jgi:hypothetical protein
MLAKLTSKKKNRYVELMDISLKSDLILKVAVSKYTSSNVSAEWKTFKAIILEALISILGRNAGCPL